MRSMTQGEARNPRRKHQKLTLVCGFSSVFCLFFAFCFFRYLDQFSISEGAINTQLVFLWVAHVPKTSWSAVNFFGTRFFGALRFVVVACVSCFFCNF